MILPLTKINNDINTNKTTIKKNRIFTSSSNNLQLLNYLEPVGKSLTIGNNIVAIKIGAV